MKAKKRTLLFFGMGLLVCALCVVPLLPSLLPKPVLLENIPFGKIVLDGSGDILRLGLASDDKYRLRIRLGDVAPEAVAALILYEDRHFYRHPGVNIFSIARAALGMLAGNRRMGASTLTMQTARLLCKIPTTSILGKLKQIWLALRLEAHYSKEEILEAYFNLAPYGGNIEGIEAAARIYFDKPAIQLTDMECHALMVVPQNPVARNPITGPRFEQARKRLEQYLKAETGHELPMTDAPLRLRSPDKLSFPAPHLSLELLLKMGPESDRVQTGIDRSLQAKLERAISAYIRRNRRYALNNCSAIMVNTANMEVEALAGSAAFGNDSISGQIDGTRARRSPGSTLKPFIYALAVDQGLIHPGSMLPDSPRSFGGYDPENFDRGFRGPLAAAEALRASRNLPAIYLAERLRHPGLYGFLKSAQVSFEHDASHYGLALALGGAEVSMRELATLYAMLSNEGLWQPLRIDRGQPWSIPKRLLSPEAAFITLKMLESGDAFTHGRHGPIPLRFKTGTSNGLRDAWTAGIVGEYVIVVWIGNFDNEANPHFVGAQAALPLFLELAGLLADHRRLEDRAAEPSPDVNVAKTRICAATGDFDTRHCRQTAETWYIPGKSPVRDTGILRPILVDKATGLRACEPVAGKTEEVWWEFWPSDMREIFANAGINKPLPPQWLPECAERTPASSAPDGPRIMLPKKNVTYHRKINRGALRVPLQAAVDSDAGQIHWFAGASYLGSAKAGEVLFWEPRISGKVEIVAVDDLGRSSKRQCVISALP